MAEPGGGFFDPLAETEGKAAAMVIGFSRARAARRLVVGRRTDANCVRVRWRISWACPLRWVNFLGADDTQDRFSVVPASNS